MTDRSLKARYASPNLRWGLCLEDHPGVGHSFTVRTGDALGIPKEFGGDSTFCVATIIFPEPELVDAVGWKPLPPVGNPDDWNVMNTKALGRALKRAGYPDDLTELKALVHWRERNAHVALVASGVEPFGALGTGADALEAALDDARVNHPEDVGADDRPSRRDVPPGGEPPSDETTTQLRTIIGTMKVEHQRMLMADCAERGWSVTRPATEAEAQSIIELATGGELPDPGDDEVVDGHVVEDETGEAA